MKTYRKHLISLVQDEQLHVVGLQDTALDHVVNTTGGTDDDLGAITESGHVLTDVGTTNAGMALNAHEVTDGDNNLLDLLSQLTGGSKDERLARLQVGVDLLESSDGESGGLASTRLGLGNDIVACSAISSESGQVQGCRELTLDDGHDGPLLDSGGALETIGIDT